MSFKERIFLSVFSDAVNNFTTILIFLDHLIDSIDIVLSVTVHRYSNVAFVNRLRKTCKQCILVTIVTSKRNTYNARVLFRLLPYNSPCIIRTPVINKYNFAVFTDGSVYGQRIYLISKKTYR